MTRTSLQMVKKSPVSAPEGTHSTANPSTRELAIALLGDVADRAVELGVALQAGETPDGSRRLTADDCLAVFACAGAAAANLSSKNIEAIRRRHGRQA